MKRLIYFMLITLLAGNALNAEASILQDRKGKKDKGKSEQTKKEGGSGKQVKEVPKSRKQDKPEPVRGKGRR